MHYRNNHAVSELLGVIFILMISTTVISAIYVWAPQQLEDRKAYVRSQSALNQFEVMRNALQDMISRGVGNSKSVNFVTDKGYVHIGSGGTRYVIFYSMYNDFDFLISGFDIDSDDFTDTEFTYYQKGLPDWWDDLAQENKGMKLEISYPNDDTSDTDVRDSYNDDNIVFTYPGPIIIPIQFIDESSGDIDSWSWDFNFPDDGMAEPVERSDIENPTEQYSVADVYTVRLTVRDNGKESFMQHDVVVGEDLVPTAAFSYSPTNPTTGDTITFTDESTYPGGSITSWDWDFDIDEGVSTDSIDQHPVHPYDASGTYTVKLTITGGSTQTHEITVENTVPTAAFTYDPIPPPVYIGTDITFTDGSADADGTIQSRDWDFGDGVGTSGLEIPTYQYADPDVYTVSLTVTDDGGKEGIVQHDIVVVKDEEVPDPDLDRIGGGSDPVHGNNAIDFMVAEDGGTPNDWFMWIELGGVATKYDAGTDTLITLDLDDDSIPANDFTNDAVTAEIFFVDDEDGTYYWVVDNGDTLGVLDASDIVCSKTLDIVLPNDQIISDAEVAEAGPSHYYVFIDDNPANDQYDKGIMVPHAAFSYIPINPTTADTITFTDESTGTITSWEWDFDEGDPLTYTIPEDPIQHQYSEADGYTVTLTLNEGAGDESTQSHTITIDSVAPTAAFSFSPVYRWPVVAGSSLTDAVKIDVIAKEEDGLGDMIVGRIWLFDLGYIKYETSSSQTTREMIFENGATISTNQNSGYLAQEPIMYQEMRDMTDAVYNYITGQGVTIGRINDVLPKIIDFTMRIIQFKSDTEKTVGPSKCTYRFTMSLSESSVRENSLICIGQEKLNMQIFGDHATAWTDFFKSQKNFDNVEFVYEIDETIKSSLGRQNLIISHSVCDIDLEVIG